MIFYTYFHTRNDTNAVFYVGKGKGSRAHKARDRSAHWTSISAKHGHTVHIAARWPTEAEAFEHEKLLIVCFRDLGVSLCNMTEGGEGCTGLVHSEETRRRLAKASAERSPELNAQVGAKLKGRVLSSETRSKMAASHTGVAKGPHRPDSIEKMRTSRIGKKASDETRAKMSIASAGRKISDGTKEKLRAAQLGKIASADVRAKMSASAKARWAALSVAKKETV